MNKIITPEIREVIEAIHYRPAVSIIMPFEPKMNLKATLAHSLKAAADKVEKELKEYYPGELGILVMQKLRNLLKNLNFDTFKKSIAIYVSPVFEKVLYLDLAVEEKIMVDESFEIRDLIYCKKELHKYLVLLVSGKESRIYLGNSTSFIRIVSNTAETVNSSITDAPEKVSNFSDKEQRKENQMHRFLHHIDNGLGFILSSYPLPLFVLGTERILGHFKAITKHRPAIVGYIKGNYESTSLMELKDILHPHVEDWKKVKSIEILNKLQNARDEKKLSQGIKAVWKNAMMLRGNLLVVEKNYMYPAMLANDGKEIKEQDSISRNYSYIKDAVDDIIEKVLESGGDVEFVDEGLLKEYQQIALVHFY